MRRQRRAFTAVGALGRSRLGGAPVPREEGLELLAAWSNAGGVKARLVRERCRCALR